MMVLSYERGKERLCVVRCDCGRVLARTERSIRTGSSKSCGHDLSEKCLFNLRHGHTRYRKQSKEYIAWLAMKQRCFYKRGIGYKNYGGRGITVCQQWIKSFETFLRDVGYSPGPEYSLDRINNDGNYEPGNVRWIKQIYQAMNRRTSRWLTFQGQSRLLVEWAVILGIDRKRIRSRLRHGWPVEMALSKPKVIGHPKNSQMELA